MSFKVFNIDNIVVIINTDTWDVTKRSRGDIWYSYNNLEAPILYSIYQKQPETPLVLNQPCSSFITEDSSTFTNDKELIDYLDQVFNVPPTEDNLQTVKRGNDYYLKTNDISSEILLNDILEEIKIMNVQLSLITGDEIKRT
jgi:hypothetical protein